jgi:hypothetical protein
MRDPFSITALPERGILLSLDKPNKVKKWKPDWRNHPRQAE